MNNSNKTMVRRAGVLCLVPPMEEWNPNPKHLVDWCF